MNLKKEWLKRRGDEDDEEEDDDGVPEVPSGGGK